MYNWIMNSFWKSHSSACVISNWIWSQKWSIYRIKFIYCIAFVTLYLSHCICHIPFSILPLSNCICHIPFVALHLSHSICHTSFDTFYFIFHITFAKLLISDCLYYIRLVKSIFFTMYLLYCICHIVFYKLPLSHFISRITLDYVTFHLS